MQVHVDADHRRAAVVDVADLQRLVVHAPEGMAEAELAERLGDLGRLDGDHVWLSVERLRQAGPADADWAEGFEAMIGYATSKGWVQDAAVRAHVVRS